MRHSDNSETAKNIIDLLQMSTKFLAPGGVPPASGRRLRGARRPFEDFPRRRGRRLEHLCKRSNRSNYFRALISFSTVVTISSVIPVCLASGLSRRAFKVIPFANPKHRILGDAWNIVVPKFPLLVYLSRFLQLLYPMCMPFSSPWFDGFQESSKLIFLLTYILYNTYAWPPGDYSD